MSVALQLRRAVTASIAAFTGKVGELIYNTTTNRMHSQDGATAGGFPHALLTDVGFRASRTAVADTNFTVVAGTDYWASYTSISAARVVTLPAAIALNGGSIIFVGDESGSCSAANTITINRAGSDTINNAATSYVLSLPNVMVGFKSNGVGKWTTVETPYPLMAASTIMGNNGTAGPALNLTSSQIMSMLSPMLLGDGAFGAPAYSFSADTDTGLYRIGANNIGVAVNGAKVIDVSATGLGVVGTILGGDGTVSLPGVSFSADTDTGLYRIGANNIGVAVGGTKIIDVASTGVAFTGNFSFAGVLQGSTAFASFGAGASPRNVEIVTSDTNTGFASNALQYQLNIRNSNNTNNNWQSVNFFPSSAYVACFSIAVQTTNHATPAADMYWINGVGTTLLKLSNTGKLTPFASATSSAGFNLASGAAPTSPADGDMWYDGTNVKFRVGGTTKTFTLT